VPCELVHELPQALQCVTLPSVVSQPFAACASQLPKPASHAPRLHVPLAHDSAAFPNEQTTPQPPQSVSVVVGVSQPSSGFPLQFAKPAAQVGAQSYEPGMPAHAVPPWALVQVLPQVAQFAVVPSAVSQPAAAVQSANPAPQPVWMQVPVAHDAAPFGNEQACPQFTQFVLVLTGVSQPSSGFPLQFLKPASHVGVQSNEPGAPEHALSPCSFVQALPQLAQFEFVPSCVSQPFAEPQSAKPESHVPIVQVPAPQDAPACENEHGTSQSPQLVRVRMLRSHPLSATPSQLLNPAAQTGTQPVAGLQLVVPFAFVHTSLHERQCAASPRGVSQFGGPATHSAKPVAQLVAVHAPVAQDSFEFGMSHATPQTLQSVSVRVDVSQPFAVLVSQLPKPTSQVGVQTPLAHGFVPCAFEQALPQAAQFAVVPRGVSQPFVG
jgi:hypothetical protein